ncbi:MAG: general secretion pathway protein GspK, partial [Deltaproteobacteria bacterium]|nr:general secretion pathway protein GspK [Deltaproteobacteria bacterium]
MGKVLKNNRGVALILTILIISLMVTLTLHFNKSMRSELYAAVNLRDDVRLGCIARSGFNWALAVLSADAEENDFDSLHETWASLKDLSSYSSSLFDQGVFEVEVIDLSGRIQINQLVGSKGKYNDKQKDILTRFLESDKFDIDPEEVDDIIDALKDWIDPDSEVTRFGAEDSYYQALETPYTCRNAPLESLEELLLI